MKFLELVANLATRRRHLHWLPIWPPDAQLAYWFQIWPPDGANCISCKFAHQMALLSLVPYLTTRWHHLHWLQTCPPDSTTWISYKFGHHMSPLVLVPNLTTRLLFTNLTTRWHHLHYLHYKFAHQTKSHALPWIALLALSVSIDLVSSSTRVTSIKSFPAAPASPTWSIYSKSRY